MVEKRKEMMNNGVVRWEGKDGCREEEGGEEDEERSKRSVS